LPSRAEYIMQCTCDDCKMKVNSIGIEVRPKNMNVIYRISDKGKTDHRIPGVSRRVCLKNFLQVFGRDNLKIIADNCEGDTYAMLNEQGLEYDITTLGNSGSLRRAVEIASEWNGNIYFVEDDYIHREAAPLLITEGLALAEYVSLYDDPAKYGPSYDYGETTQVRRTMASHWRYTSGSRMTFATTAEVLRQDWETWMKWTQEDAPLCDPLFTELREQLRRIVTCIPGAAVHCDLGYSAFAGNCLIEDWTMDYIIMETLERILDASPQSAGMALGLQQRYQDDKLKLLGLLTTLEKEAALRKEREAASKSSEPLRL